MKMQTRVSLSNATLSLLTFVAFIFLLGTFVLVFCVGLQINPFQETITGLLIATYVGLIGISAILTLLNVASNISLIADTKMADLKIEPEGRTLKKWGVSFVVAALLLVGLALAGTYASKEKFLTVVQSQADEILKENGELLEKISVLLASGKPGDYKKIQEIKDFLQNQRKDLPQLTLIYSANFEGKIAFYQIRNFFNGDLEKNTFVPEYYNCTKGLDCSYLKNFFSGENTSVLQKYTLRDDQFYIFIPYVGKAGRFILLFDRRNSYGKFGS